MNRFLAMVDKLAESFTEYLIGLTAIAFLLGTVLPHPYDAIAGLVFMTALAIMIARRLYKRRSNLEFADYVLMPIGALGVALATAVLLGASHTTVNSIAWAIISLVIILLLLGIHQLTHLKRVSR